MEASYEKTSANSHQMQGRVRPTMQMKGVGVNDDAWLEREADVMGNRTTQLKNHDKMQMKLSAQLQALVYTQSTDIHVGPGQDRFLPHEAWHVVQLLEGRVRPTMQMKGMGIYDDVGLERKANVMGTKALQMHPTELTNNDDKPSQKIKPYLYGIENRGFEGDET